MLKLGAAGLADLLVMTCTPSFALAPAAGWLRAYEVRVTRNEGIIGGP